MHINRQCIKSTPEQCSRQLFNEKLPKAQDVEIEITMQCIKIITQLFQN